MRKVVALLPLLFLLSSILSFRFASADEIDRGEDPLTAFFEGNGHKYQLVDQSLTWEEAKEADKVYYYRNFGHFENVPATKSWTIQFTQAVSEQTIDESTIYIMDDIGQKIDVTYEMSRDGKHVTVSPVKPYEANGYYTLVIDVRVYSTNGNHLVEGANVSFTVADVQSEIDREKELIGEWSFTMDGKPFLFEITSVEEGKIWGMTKQMYGRSEMYSIEGTVSGDIVEMEIQYDSPTFINNTVRYLSRDWKDKARTYLTNNPPTVHFSYSLETGIGKYHGRSWSLQSDDQGEVVLVYGKEDVKNIVVEKNQVEDEIEYPVVAEIDEIKIKDRTKVKLPKYVDVYFSSGNVREVEVDWNLDQINQISEESFELRGSLDGIDREAVVTVHLTSNFLDGLAKEFLKGLSGPAFPELKEELGIETRDAKFVELLFNEALKNADLHKVLTPKEIVLAHLKDTAASALFKSVMKEYLHEIGLFSRAIEEEDEIASCLKDVFAARVFPSMIDGYKDSKDCMEKITDYMEDSIGLSMSDAADSYLDELDFSSYSSLSFKDIMGEVQKEEIDHHFAGPWVFKYGSFFEKEKHLIYLYGFEKDASGQEVFQGKVNIFAGEELEHDYPISGRVVVDDKENKWLELTITVTKEAVIDGTNRDHEAEINEYFRQNPSKLPYYKLVLPLSNSDKLKGEFHFTGWKVYVDEDQRVISTFDSSNLNKHEVTVERYYGYR